MALDVTLACYCGLQVQEEIWIGSAMVLETPPKSFVVVWS